MKSIISILACLILCATATGQKNITMLLSKLQKEKTDTANLERYRDVFEYYKFSNPDSALYYGNQGLDYFYEREDKNGTAGMHYLLASLDAIQGRAEQARKGYLESLRLFEEVGNHNGIATVYNGLGVMEGRAANNDAAIRYFLKALKEYEGNKNLRGIALTYLKLGNIYDGIRNYNKALEYYNSAVAIARKERFTETLIYLYNNIGITYFKMGNNKKGFDYLELALVNSDSPEMTEMHLLSLSNMGNAYNTINNSERALEYYNKALQIPSLDKLPEQKARLMLNIAAVTAETDTQKALASINEALAISRSINNRRLQRDALGAMIDVYKDNGDYKNALAVTDQEQALADSIFSIEKEKEIANLQSTYDLEKSREKVKGLQLAEKKNMVQRNTIIFIAIILLGTLALLTLQYRKADKINVQLNKRKKELQKANATKDRIFSIIGHDLRGPIANIPMVIELIQDPRTDEEEKQYMLHLLTENSMASLDTLDKLLHWGKAQIKGTTIRQSAFNAYDCIQNKMKLLRGAATNKNITITNNVANDISIFADKDHFEFIIRNLLSNAIKFSHRNSEIEINADHEHKPGFTIFSVKDNGVGIEKDRQSSVFEAFGTSNLGTENEGGTSIGLMLCKEFVTENGGSIWLESEQGKGTTFYFSLKKEIPASKISNDVLAAEMV